MPLNVDADRRDVREKHSSGADRPSRVRALPIRRRGACGPPAPCRSADGSSRAAPRPRAHRQGPPPAPSEHQAEVVQVSAYELTVSRTIARSASPPSFARSTPSWTAWCRASSARGPRKTSSKSSGPSTRSSSRAAFVGPISAATDRASCRPPRSCDDAPRRVDDPSTRDRSRRRLATRDPWRGLRRSRVFFRDLLDGHAHILPSNEFLTNG